MKNNEAKTMIYGRNAVTEAIRGAAGVEKILIQKNIEGEGKKVFALAKKAGIPVQVVPRFVLDKETGGAAHQGVAAYTTEFVYAELSELYEAARASGEAPFLLALDGIEDPHNLGSILRSAEGAGVHGVVIPKHRAAAVTATVMKVSAGAAAHMKIARVPNLTAALADMKEHGLWIFGLEADGLPYREADYSGSGGLCLVIGSEGAGVSRIVREACDFLVAIPMRGKIGSLNAGSAAAVAMFEISARRREGTV